MHRFNKQCDLPRHRWATIVRAERPPALSLVTQFPCWRARRPLGRELHDPRVDVPKVAIAMSQITCPSPHTSPCVLNGSLSSVQVHALSSIMHRALSYISPAHIFCPMPQSALAMRSSSILEEDRTRPSSGQIIRIVRQREYHEVMIGRLKC